MSNNDLSIRGTSRVSRLGAAGPVVDLTCLAVMCLSSETKTAPLPFRVKSRRNSISQTPLDLSKGSLIRSNFNSPRFPDIPSYPIELRLGALGWSPWPPLAPSSPSAFSSLGACCAVEISRSHESFFYFHSSIACRPVLSHAHRPWFTASHFCFVSRR